jgi:hypothetical protein
MLVGIEKRLPKSSQSPSRAIGYAETDEGMKNEGQKTGVERSGSV